MTLGGPATGGPPAGGTGSAVPAAKASCGAPTSRFGKGSVLRPSGARLRGAATPGAGRTPDVGGRGHRPQDGQAVPLPAGRRLVRPKRSCLRTEYLRARGTKSWRLETKARLPRGSYVVWSRAVNSAGTIERKAKARNLLLTKVKR